jgi:hypothetical protein
MLFALKLLIILSLQLLLRLLFVLPLSLLLFSLPRTTPHLRLLSLKL